MTELHIEVDPEIAPGIAMIYILSTPTAKSTTLPMRFDDYCRGSQLYMGQRRMPYHPRNTWLNLRMCVIGYLLRVGQLPTASVIRWSTPYSITK